MKKFAIKVILFCIPVLPVLGSYFIYDPFKVLYHYDNFYKDFFVSINRDYASTQLFIQNNPIHRYDSFIFGSSRTMAYHPNDWKKHFKDSIHPFVFDASSERLMGIWAKIKFLDKEQVPIKNAMVILCTDQNFIYNQQAEGVLFIRHPKVDNSNNYLQFHDVFFSNYLKHHFFIRYLDYKISDKNTRQRGENMDFIEVSVDSVSNHLYRKDLDLRIEKDSLLYYEQANYMFYERSNQLQYSEDQIDARMESMFREMKIIFDKHKTNYKIVISPLYNQRKTNHHDLELLQSIFGREQVYDFSGINSITNNKFNYYENSHYRPLVGSFIMDSIYAQ